MQELLLEQAERVKRSMTPNNIPGWGMDADPENDPTYPMKKRDTEIDHAGMNYEKAPQQQSDIEVLHSNERPSITRVFGTSTPPSGLSGKIRRHAFKYSEATAAHWMSLILADRVNVVEGIIDDIRNGKVPNLFSELGWRAEWEYNRTKFLTKIGVYAAVITFLVMKAKPKKRKRSWI